MSYVYIYICLYIQHIYVLYIIHICLHMYTYRKIGLKMKMDVDTKRKGGLSGGGRGWSSNVNEVIKIISSQCFLFYKKILHAQKYTQAKIN